MILDKIYYLIGCILVLFFLSQCCTVKENVEDKNPSLLRNNFPPPSLSPGTAKVSATLIKLTKDNSKTLGLFKIDTVHAYGPSTRPIGVGSQLDIEFHTDAYTAVEKSEILEIFKPKTKHKLTIGYSLTASKRGQPQPWQIISIK